MSRSIFFIALLWFAFISGQTPTSNYLSLSLGFPAATYYDVIEDNQHNVWLSSNVGVFKYDGYYCTKVDNTATKSEVLFYLQEDDDKVLWGINIYGELCYFVNDRFEVFIDLGTKMTGQLPQFKVFDQYILFYSDKGVYRIDKSDKKVHHIATENIISSYISDKQSYYTTFDTFSLFAFQNNQIKKCASLTSGGIYNAAFFSIFERQVLLKYDDARKENHLFRIHLEDNSVEKIHLPNALKNKKIISIKSIQNELWFCTNDGVKTYTFDAGRLVLKKEYFKGQTISYFIKDYKNNFWFVDLDRGVFVVEDMNRYTIDIPQGKITASAFLKDNQFALATNQSDLLLYDGFRLIKKIKLKGCSDIYALYYNRFKNEIIVSTKHKKSFVYAISKDTYASVENKYTIAKSMSFVTPSLTFYGNYKEGYLYDGNEVKKIRTKRVVASASTPDDLLMSYSDGVYHYDVHQKTLHKVEFENEAVFAVKIKSTKQGFFLLDNKQRVFRFFNGELFYVKSISDFKPKNLFYHHDRVCFINKDGQLMCYDVATQKVELSSFYQGILEFGRTRFLEDYTVVFRPFQFELFPQFNSLNIHDDTLSNVVIEKLVVNDIERNRSKNELKSNQNKIDFHFKTSGYLAKERVLYEYQLIPLDDQWQTLDAGMKSVSFKELPSGEYQFKVRAKSRYTNNYTASVNYEFEIATPVWRRWWFIVLICMGIAAMAFFLLKRALAKKEKKQRQLFNQVLQEKHMATLRLENLRSQMNPHFVFNSLNSIQDYIVSNESKLASTYLVKFSRLIRLYLDYSQRKNITVKEEIDALKLYLGLEKVRFNGNLDYDIMYNHELLNDKVPSLFIQPYVENALQHGLIHKEGNRVLRVVFTEKENVLEVIIQDNGVGREKAKSLSLKMHQPFATKANNEMVKIYNETFNRKISVRVEDLVEGTKVVVRIPL